MASLSPRLSHAIATAALSCRRQTCSSGSPANLSTSAASIPSADTVARRRVSSTTGCRVTARAATSTTGAPSESVVTTSSRSAPSASGTHSYDPSATAKSEGARRDVAEQRIASIARLQCFQRPDGQYRAAQITVSAGGPAHLLADDRHFGERRNGTSEFVRHLEPNPPGSGEP